MKKQEIRNISIVLILCGLFFAFLQLYNADEVLAMEYSIENVEASSAQIHFDRLNEDYTLVSITDAENNRIDLTAPTYNVENNGEYVFEVTYIDEEGEEATFYQTIVIDQLDSASSSSRSSAQLVPDENFRNYLITEVGLPYDFDISDLQSVTSISYDVTDASKRISDLTGIEYMTSLKYIYLNDQNIKTLEPMRNAVYPHLTIMEFSNWSDGTNEISDFSLLTATRFPSLNEQMMFNNNGITNEELATLPKTDTIQHAVFHFQNNYISDLTPFTYYLNAERLVLSHNQIEDLTPLSGLTTISSLHLSNNNIKDISPLSSIQTKPNATFRLNNNRIDDLSPLKDMDIFIYAQSSSDIDPYLAPEDNLGQQVQAETIYGDKATGKITITSTITNRDGNIAEMEIDGELKKEVTLQLDSKSQSEYTYKVEYNTNDTRYLVIVRQPIIWWSNPAMTTSTTELYVGDVFDPFAGISAVDCTGKDITNNIEVLSSTVDTTAAGTYEVIYKVTDIKGYTSELSRIVKVHQELQINVYGQKYEINNERIDYSVKTNVEAHWQEAQNKVGEKPKKTSVDKSDITYKITNGPSTTFDQVGIYQIEYTIAAGNEIEKKTTVPILITDEDSTLNNDATLLISAQGYQLSYSNSKDANASSLISFGNARAFQIDYDEYQNIIGFQDVSNSITVSDDSLSDVKNGVYTGGIYNIIYTIASDENEVSKNVNAVVLGGSTPQPTPVENDELAITAKSFTITNREAKTLSRDDAIERAEVYVTLLKRTEMIDLVSLDEEALKLIHNVGEEGGEYTLTFYATDENSKKTVTTTVSVYVRGVNERIDVEGGQSNSSIANNSSGIGAGDINNNALQMAMYLMIASSCIMVRWVKKYRKQK